MSENLTGRLAIKARQIRPGTAQMLNVKQGQVIQIVDVQGKQVADFVAFNADDRAEYLSVAATRGMNANVMLQQGQTLYSNRRTPMLEISADTVGRHDTLFATCDPKRYEALGAPGHDNCRTALADALAPFGVVYDQVPDPVNWFMNVAIRQRGELEIREPLSEAGDQVQLTALMDLVVAVSACPQDLVPTNGAKPSDILIRIYREASAAPIADTVTLDGATETAPPEVEPSVAPPVGAVGRHEIAEPDAAGGSAVVAETETDPAVDRERVQSS
ncbi:MAG: urea carboxylase-associated family protein [Chloroflexota bacterium]|nr:urea carboxylase-associated family protein [Chloroflexota bacterium]